MTFPDQPYLHWKYNYEETFADRPSQVVVRENPKDYLDGCRALFDMFSKFVHARKDLCRHSNTVDFDSAEDKIKTILAIEDSKEGRYSGNDKIA